MHSREALKSNHDEGVEEKRERSFAAVGNGNVDDSSLRRGRGEQCPR